MTKKFFGVRGAPPSRISGCRKFCNRRFFGQNSRFWGLGDLWSEPHHCYGQKIFLCNFGFCLAPKKFLGCGAHPQTHFRPSKNSAACVFLRKNRDFYKFLPISAKYPIGFDEVPYRLWGHMGPKKAVAPQKVCAHTRHTFFEASKYPCFRSTKRQHFDEKNFYLCLIGAHTCLERVKLF